jgi:serine protease DegQ
MSEAALQLSESLADAAAQAGAAVVRVESGRRHANSGIVWSAAGDVITLHPELETGQELTLVLPDGGSAAARVVGQDPSTNVTLLHCEAAGLTPVTWRERPAPRVGELVLALARTQGGTRAGLGIVSGLRAPHGGHGGHAGSALLQTDLRPGAGFSGGLLVDVRGQGLGMNGLSGWRGQPIAVPPAALQRIVDALRAHGRVERGYLGLSAYPAALPARWSVPAGQPEGLVVIGVEPDGPADRGGLCLGDVLLSLEGTSVGNLGELQAFLGEESVGHPVRARILRSGSPQELTIAVGSRP